MKNEINESQLREYGFTEKEISRLREILTRPESKNDSYATLLEDLSKRFLASIAIFVFVLFLALLFVLAGRVNAIAFSLTFVFIFLVLYAVTPVPLAWKAYNALKKVS